MGQRGWNILSGGGNLGNDTLVGGLGADTFAFGLSSGADVINGFSSAEGDWLSFGGQTYTFSDDGRGGALFTLSGGGTVDLTGVAASSITMTFFV